MKCIQGKIWKFGDNIDTDIIIPARHLVLPLEEMKQFAMAPLFPEFAERAGSGDIIVAGKNFGCGSSREQAPAVLRALGISAVVAQSFARIFFRNTINLGMPAVTCVALHQEVNTGDIIRLDPVSGKIDLLGNQVAVYGSRLPDFLVDIIDAGGLVPFLTA